jgi:hypothetical protein
MMQQHNINIVVVEACSRVFGSGGIVPDEVIGFFN